MTDQLQLWGSKPCKSNLVKDKDYAGRCKRNQAKWDAYTSGKCYVLYYKNRTCDHSGRVQAYGKTPVDAVKRWYRGLDGNDNWKRQCVKVVAVYTCADTHTSEAGELVMGNAQDSAPW